MSVVPSVALSELMATKAGSVDPAKFPDEVFDLYSIPAFDKGQPEIVAGSSIGSAKQVVKPGDVLLSKIVPHIRRSWVVGNDRGRRLIASGEWIVFRSDRIDTAYLRHVLVGNPFHAQFMQTVSGVGGSLLRARPAQVAKISVPLPPLPEQHRIAAILDQADALRAKRREALAQLDILTQSIFIEMFGDPVTNPKGWVTKKLKEITTFENGDRSGNYPSGDDIKTKGVLFLSTKNITDGLIDLRNTVYITEEKFASLSRGKARRYDLIITLRGTLGSCCIFDCAHETGFINAQMMIIRPGAECHHTYLHALITSRHAQERLASLSRGAAVPQLTATQLAEFPIPVPPMHDQIAFAKCKDSLDKLMGVQSSARMELDALFASLQHRAFRGEL